MIVSLSFSIAIIAFTYSVILTSPGMILETVAVWLYKALPEWLFLPIIGCEKCVAGQMAFWYCVFFADGLNVFECLLVICLSIFIVTFIKPIYSWSQRF